MDQFPPNSKKSKAASPEEKRVERVTSGEAIRRKKPLRKQFAETFVVGSPREAMQSVIFSVLIPTAKDMLTEAVETGFRSLIFGDSKRRGISRSSSGSYGHVNYNRMSMTSRREEEPRRTMSRRGRASHDFEEIVLTNRGEATDVIDRMFDIVGRYGEASVADLYAMVGVEPNHADEKWGWDELHGADVTRVRNGYLLDLPEPEPLG